MHDYEDAGVAARALHKKSLAIMCFEKSIEMWTQYGSGPHSDEAAQQLAEANIKMERSRL